MRQVLWLLSTWLALGMAWAQQPTPEELATQTRAASGLLLTMIGGLCLTFLLLHLFSRRERHKAKQAAREVKTETLPKSPEGD